MPSDHKAQIVTMRWGPYFSSRFVNGLKADVAAHLGLPYEFVCITDNAEGLDDDIVVKPIPEEFLARPELQHGLFWKLAIFKPGMLREGSPAMFLDLDSVVVGDLDGLFRRLDADPAVLWLMDNLGYGWRPWLFPFTPRHFTRLLASFGIRNKRLGNTSLQLFYPERQTQIYRSFMQRLERSGLDAIRDQYCNDQRFVSGEALRLKLVGSQVCCEFMRLYERGFLSFYWPRKTLPKTAAVVTFNGRPKPDDVLQNWDSFKRRLSPFAREWVRSVWRR